MYCEVAYKLQYKLSTCFVTRCTVYNAWYWTVWNCRCFLCKNVSNSWMMVIWLIKNVAVKGEFRSKIVSCHVKHLNERLCFYRSGSHRMAYWRIIPASTFCLLPLSHGFCTAERWHSVCTSYWNCRESPICKEKRVGKTVDDEWSTNWTNSSPDISTSYYTKEGELLIGNFVLFLVCLTVFEPLQLNVFETYKECTINKASLYLSTNEKSPQLPM